MRIIKTILVASFLVLPLCVLADEVPVVDAVPANVNTNQQTQTVNSNVDQVQPASVDSNQSQPQSKGFFSRFFSSDDSSGDQSQPMDTDSRVKRLEQQFSYIQQLKIPDKIEQMQKSIETLRGLVDTQGYRLQQLEDQQRNLYADLDKRLTVLSGKAGTTSVSAPSAIAPQQAGMFSSTVSAAALSAKETQAYQKSFGFIQTKKYSDAISVLQDYLKKYPSGQFVSNAHYWLGELYSISGNNDQAIAEFNTVVNSYSDSNKAPDALLKLGLLSFDKEQFDQAKQFWQTLVGKYPNSSAAKIASTRLQQLQR